MLKAFSRQTSISRAPFSTENSCPLIVTLISSVDIISIKTFLLKIFSLTDVQNCQPDNFIAFVTNYHIVVSQFAVGRHARLFEIDIQNIGFRVVRRPQKTMWRCKNRRREFQAIIYFGGDRNKFLSLPKISRGASKTP